MEAMWMEAMVSNKVIDARRANPLRAAGRSLSGMRAGDPAQGTVLENPVQNVLRRPSHLDGKSIYMTIVEGENKGASYDLTGVGTYTIGRHDCDIVLNDEKVSRKHASVTIVRGDNYTVADLASRNGTFVNGARLSGQELRHNDLIRIGDTTMRFTVFDNPIPMKG